MIQTAPGLHALTVSLLFDMWRSSTRVLVKTQMRCSTACLLYKTVLYSEEDRRTIECDDRGPTLLVL